MLSEFVRGQRIVFTRNPRYWRKDAERGSPLPHLDRITMQIVPDQDAELLRLEAGQSDMTSSRDAAVRLRAAQARRRGRHGEAD